MEKIRDDHKFSQKRREREEVHQQFNESDGTTE